MSRSFKMSNDVYAAMLARGFTGEIRTYSRYRMRRADWLRAGRRAGRCGRDAARGTLLA